MQSPNWHLAHRTSCSALRVGAGVNQSVFVMPGWFSSPPQSLAKGQASGTFKAFWIPLQVASALTLAGAFAFNRKSDERRKPLSLALGFYVGTCVSTAAYFAPEIIRLGRPGADLSAGEIARRGKRWLALTWGRHLALGAAWVLTLAAMARKPKRLAALRFVRAQWTSRRRSHRARAEERFERRHARARARAGRRRDASGDLGQGGDG